jgi:uncharacterized protein YjbI with pentapeptide repeats
VCGLDGLGDADLCILHSEDPEKDTMQFWEAFNCHRRSTGDTFFRFVFPRDCDFISTKFEKGANFANAVFNEDAQFYHANFIGGANFRHAIFGGRADFGRVEFKGAADFSDAKFHGDALFYRASFVGTDYFGGALHQAQLHPSEPSVPTCADFFGAKFNSDASFSEAGFTDAPDFRSIKFAKAASFYATVFQDRPNFSRVRFQDKANFVRTRFRHGIVFTGSTFGKTCILASERDEDHNFVIFSGTQVDFNWVIIEPDCKLIFRDADLRKCQFLGTDLRNIEFTNVIWPQVVSSGCCINIGEDRIGIYDEVLFLEGQPVPLIHIEKAYRELKQNYEDRRDYDRAGDFHYGEKEMRRINVETSLQLRSILTVYGIVSGYGERYLRPLAWTFLLFICSTVGYLSFGLHSKQMDRQLVWGNMWDRLTAGLYSLRVMSLLSPEDLVPVNWWGFLVQTIDNLFGPALIGLFLLALRQRLKR